MPFDFGTGNEAVEAHFNTVFFENDPDMVEDYPEDYASAMAAAKALSLET